jgi:hypothetical protein
LLEPVETCFAPPPRLLETLGESIALPPDAFEGLGDAIARFELDLKGSAPEEGPHGLDKCEVKASVIDSAKGSVFRLGPGDVSALRSIFKETATSTAADVGDFTGEAIQNMLSKAVQRVRGANRIDAPPCAPCSVHWPDSESRVLVLWRCPSAPSLVRPDLFNRLSPLPPTTHTHTVRVRTDALRPVLAGLNGFTAHWTRPLSLSTTTRSPTASARREPPRSWRSTRGSRSAPS